MLWGKLMPAQGQLRKQDTNWEAKHLKTVVTVDKLDRHKQRLEGEHQQQGLSRW